MRPSQVVESLRKLADHVEATDSPSLHDARRALSAVVTAMEPGTWTITLNDRSSGDITITSPDGSETFVSGDDAAVEALGQASGDDTVRLVRGYFPYGETTMSASEVRSIALSGLWGFEGAEAEEEAGEEPGESRWGELLLEGELEHGGLKFEWFAERDPDERPEILQVGVTGYDSAGEQFDYGTTTFDVTTGELGEWPWSANAPETGEGLMEAVQAAIAKEYGDTYDEAMDPSLQY